MNRLPASEVLIRQPFQTAAGIQEASVRTVIRYLPQITVGEQHAFLRQIIQYRLKQQGCKGGIHRYLCRRISFRRILLNLFHNKPEIHGISIA